MKSLMRGKQWLFIIFGIVLLSTAYYYFYHCNNSRDIVVLKPSQTNNKILFDGGTTQPTVDPSSALYEYFFGKDNSEHFGTKLSVEPEEPLAIMQDDVQSSHDDATQNIFSIIDNKNHNSNHNNIFDKVTTLISVAPQTGITDNEKDIQVLEISSTHPLSLKTKEHKINKYYYLELSSGLSPEALMSEWQAIKTTHSKILHDDLNINIYIQKQYIDNKILYTLHVGKFNDFASARAICRKLIINKQHCLIVYN